MNCIKRTIFERGVRCASLILSVVIFGLLIGGCNDASSPATTTTGVPNSYTRSQSLAIISRFTAGLPAVDQLYTLNRAIGSDSTVVLAWEGGPKSSINCSYFDDFIPSSQYATAIVHEGQQHAVGRVKLRNAGKSGNIISLVANGDAEITAEEAAQTNLLSYAILEKVRKHFADQEKQVVFVGHSFGAMLLPGYLTLLGNNFDRMALLAGRTEMPLKVISNTNAGNVATFSLAPDPADSTRCLRTGISLINRAQVLDTITNSGIAFMTEEACGGVMYQVATVAPYVLSTFRLQANAASNYQVADLYRMNLSNLLVVTGRNDAAVGVMGSSEVQGLRGARATVCVTNDGHGLDGLGVAGTAWLPQFIGGGTTASICPSVANTVSCSS